MNANCRTRVGNWLLNGGEPPPRTDRAHFGVFFIRKVVQGYGGTCKWHNTKSYKRTGEGPTETTGVAVEIALPAMPMNSAATVGE